MPSLASHLFQALFTEGALGCMIQAAFQTVFTEGVATWCSHRLIEQPVLITDNIILKVQSFASVQQELAFKQINAWYVCIQ